MRLQAPAGMCESGADGNATGASGMTESAFQAAWQAVLRDVAARGDALPFDTAVIRDWHGPAPEALLLARSGKAFLLWFATPEPGTAVLQATPVVAANIPPLAPVVAYFRQTPAGEVLLEIPTLTGPARQAPANHQAVRVLVDVLTGPPPGTGKPQTAP